MGLRGATWTGIAALAFALRLVHLYDIHGSPVAEFLFGDGRAYDDWAQRIVAGDWIGEEVFYQAPLYPYFLALVYEVAGHSLFAVRIVQAVLGAAACVLLGVAGSRFFDERTGRCAALLLAVWPSALFADALIQKSALDTFLLCALLALLAAALHGRDRWWLPLGTVLGLLVLTRENALVFVPVLLAVCLWTVRGPRQVRAAAAFLLGLALVLLPVAVRNLVVGGELHLTTAQFGPNFYIGNSASATGTYRPLRYGRGDPRYERSDATELAQEALGVELTPSQVSGYWTDRALADIRAHPLEWMALVVRKGVLIANRVEVGDAEDQYTHGDWSRLLAALGPVLNFGLLLPLAAAGMVLAWGRPRSAAVLVALVVAYSLTLLATYVMARYRHPLLPLLLLLAAVGIVEGYRRLRTGRWRSMAAPLAVAAAVAVPAHWQLLRVDTVRAGSLYNIGRTLEDDPTRRQEALAYYRRAVQLEPQDAMGHNNLGTLLEKLGRAQEALPHVRRAVELRPDHANFHYNFALVRARLGDGLGALESYRRTLELSPAHADAHNNLGALLQAQGRLDEAIAEFQAAIAAEPRHGSALNNLGVCQAQRGEIDLAIRSFRAAVDANPESASAQENLARALAEAAGAR